MDEKLREQLRIIAEAEGLDPEVLYSAFDGSPMPEALEKAVETVLGDVELFDLALSKLKSPEQ